MKILFAGPSLFGAPPLPPGIELRPPAAHGDLVRAVLDGAGAIGLVDGLFETVAAVWHKEILFALSRGVTVLGAASMGALRAAECAPFGMVPVGAIAERYIGGELDDDAAVAQLHAPAELGHAPLTQALVDVEATVEHLAADGLLDPAERGALLDSAQALFFKHRTLAAVVAGVPGLAPDRRARLTELLRRNDAGLKRRDALLLVERLAVLPTPAAAAPPAWTLAEPGTWRRALLAARTQRTIS